MQAMGQNALAVVEELGKQLALRSSKNITQLDAEKTIFFDVLGMFMVDSILIPSYLACKVWRLGTSLPTAADTCRWSTRSGGQG